MKKLKKSTCKREKEAKTHEGGVFHTQNGCQSNCFDECYVICFLNICEKTSPKSQKLQSKSEKNGMQGGEKQKNVKRVFFTAKMGAKKIVLTKSMIFAF